MLETYLINFFAGKNKEVYRVAIYIVLKILFFCLVIQFSQ